MRFKLVIEYDGTEYHGWQVQPNGRTIQGELEQALHRMRGETTRVVAAGRTDAGVHAAGQVVSFTLERSIAPDTLAAALNALTPRDLSIRSAEVVADEFDPRRGAVSRVYLYRIWNASWASPFWRRYACHVRCRLNMEAMRAAAATLIGEHDFTSFRAAGCDAAHARRQVLRSRLDIDGSLVVYTIEANAFLRCMVRNIVGTLLEVGRGTRNSADVGEILAARDRTCAGPTAPPHGLCLAEVKY